MYYDNNRFTKLIRITEKDLEFLKKNKGKKSIAGYLELVIKEYKKIKRI